MLRAGNSRIDITPGADAPLIGYGFGERSPDGNEGVLDPLFATALALESDGEPPVVLFSIDLCVLENDVAEWLRTRLGEALAVPAKRVILACSHTHSGPQARPEDLPGSAPGVPQLGNGGPVASAYAEFLLEKLRDCGQVALDGLRPARLAWRQGALDLGYGRRSPDGRGGVRNCWNVHEFPDREPQPLTEPTASLLRLDFGPVGQGAVLWFSAGLHPVVMGKHSHRISADWPGYCRTFLEREVAGARTFFTLDACGETHPWLATQADPEAIGRVGRAVAAPLALWADSLPAPAPVEAMAWREDMLEVGGARLPVGVLRLGHLAVLFLPLELFGSLGHELRCRWGRPLLIATLANGWEAYWPDERAFAEGGYEVEIALRYGRSPGDGERLVERALALLEETFDGPGPHAH